MPETCSETMAASENRPIVVTPTERVAVTRSISLLGLQGQVVHIEVLAAHNVPAFILVGLPDTALNEAKDRVRAAFCSCGIEWPARRVTVNLGPASLRKTGTGFDLGIAMAVLASIGEVEPEAIEASVFLGELGLDGGLRPIRGILPAVHAAVAAGFTSVIVPAESHAEARLVPGARVHAFAHLAQVALHFGARIAPPAITPSVAPSAPAPATREALDLADVIGQPFAREALEIAAAGGHSLLLLGPPGTGKTMLAARLPGLLPDLSEADAVEVTALHSIAGTFDPAHGLMRRPPYEDPHHTATAAAVVGGGSGLPRPGAASRAHCGVLFLDEAPEFSAAVLQTLRQPLETGELVLQRAGGVARYPARFQLVLAANPCPCGNAVGKGLACTCTPLARRRYFARLGGPLLDRIDLQVDVLPVKAREAGIGRERSPAGESTAAVAKRVAEARARQRERYRDAPWSTNAHVLGAELRACLRRAGGGLTGELETAIARGQLTLRGLDRVTRVARTIADLEGRDDVTDDDIARALGLRRRGTR